MEYKAITAVGIDVSKGKSTVAVRRPGGEIVLMPFQVNHDTVGLSSLVKTFLALAERFVSLWSTRGCTGVPLPWR